MSKPGEDDDKYKKLKRAIAVGVILILGILGWHLYEYFAHKQKANDGESDNEHDIGELTKKLFADELKHNPYLERINFQHRTKPFDTDDQAAQPLLELHAEFLTTNKSSTIYHMRRLFDNYELDSALPEQVTPEQLEEQLDFLNAVLKTRAMQRTMKFLRLKGKVYRSYSSQLRLLQNIWFTPFARGKGLTGSSGFEHVFLAELKDQQVLGLHNWIYFSEQEQQGLLNYAGYIERIDMNRECKLQKVRNKFKKRLTELEICKKLKHDDKYLLATRFTFHNITKTYNTLFLGTSPEFELSLYTLCFVLSQSEPCLVHLAGTMCYINTHTLNWHGKIVLTSAYPSIIW